jgi:hypothetical protein
MPDSAPRLCASCGFSVEQGVSRDGYMLHAGPCVAYYACYGPRYTPEYVRDCGLIMAYDLDSPVEPLSAA